MNSAMCDFKDCVRSIEVMDIHSTGLHFTWNQKPKGRNGVLKKLDRIMGNLEFIDTYQTRSHYEGFKVNKPNKPNYVWNPKNTKAGNDKTKDDSYKLVNHNPFDALNAMESVNEMGESGGGKEETITVKDKENDTDYESE
ncbi:hypothetical protein Tco_0358477, partial [Tanacetum coccineum]